MIASTSLSKPSFAAFPTQKAAMRKLFAHVLESVEEVISDWEKPTIQWTTEADLEVDLRRREDRRNACLQSLKAIRQEFDAVFPQRTSKGRYLRKRSGRKAGTKTPRVA